MYIRFVLDPFVPHGIDKVIRRVIKDLRKIFKDVTYSTETDSTLNPSLKGGTLPVTKIFQRKVGMNCRGVVFYIVNANLTWKKEEVFGLSSPSRCAIGLRDISSNGYRTWSAKVWELVLHELGHSFGLIRKSRIRSQMGRLGTVHCLNNCVMSEDRFDVVWSKKARMRFNSESPYCHDCLKYLLLKDA